MSRQRGFEKKYGKKSDQREESGIPQGAEVTGKGRASAPEKQSCTRCNKYMVALEKIG